MVRIQDTYSQSYATRPTMNIYARLLSDDGERMTARMDEYLARVGQSRRGAGQSSA